MSYDRIGNTQVRENGKKRSIFDKVNEIKKDLHQILPEIEGDRLIAMFSKIRTYYRHKKKGVPMGRKGWKGFRDLTLSERVLYDYLLKHNLNPCTTGWKGFRDLTLSERVLYDYLLKHNLNPCTTYRWFIATRIPEDVKDKLEKGQLSLKNAMRISANRRRVKMSNQGLLIMEEIRTIMGGL